MSYVIQFVAGAQELVRESLARTVRKLRILYSDDSSMMFESSTRISSSAQLPFANNVFIVLAKTPRKNLAPAVRQLTTQVSRTQFPSIKGAHAGFRLMFHFDGALVSIDRQLRTGLERAISRRTRSQVASRGSCQEYWIIGRRDLDDLLLCARLPKAKRPDKAKGSLSYELSAMLLAASQPQKGETFLDPFGGSGALVEARLDSPARLVVYSDTALGRLLPMLPRRLKSSDRHVQLLDEDATRLHSIGDGQIDVIVTDPPWGEFDELDLPYPAFADAIAQSFNRVLDRQSGRFVILSSRRNAESLVESLTRHEFKVSSTPGILVNGHPATVVIGRR